MLQDRDPSSESAGSFARYVRLDPAPQGYQVHGQREVGRFVEFWVESSPTMRQLPSGEFLAVVELPTTPAELARRRRLPWGCIHGSLRARLRSGTAKAHVHTGSL